MILVARSVCRALRPSAQSLPHALDFHAVALTPHPVRRALSINSAPSQWQLPRAEATPLTRYISLKTSNAWTNSSLASLSALPLGLHRFWRGNGIDTAASVSSRLFPARGRHRHASGQRSPGHLYHRNQSPPGQPPPQPRSPWTSFIDALNRVPPGAVIAFLFIVNVAVFGLWQYAKYQAAVHKDVTWIEWMARHFTISTQGIRDGRWWTFLTMTVSQADPGHMAVNTLMLLLFARPLASLFGTPATLGLWLGGGIAAAICSLLFSEQIRRPAISRKTGQPAPPVLALGASAALYAFVGAFTWVAPWQQLLFFYVVPMPASLLTGGILAYEAFQMWTELGKPLDGTDHAGHIVGILFGMAFAALKLPRNPVMQATVVDRLVRNSNSKGASKPPQFRPRSQERRRY